jgi:hypothetical protein
MSHVVIIRYWYNYNNEGQTQITDQTFEGSNKELLHQFGHKIRHLRIGINEYSNYRLESDN